jgi:hypothetical protein
MSGRPRRLDHPFDVVGDRAFGQLSTRSRATANTPASRESSTSHLAVNIPGGPEEATLANEDP